MRSILLILYSSFFYVASLQSQSLQLSVGGGFAGYQGDLQNKVLTINTSNPGFSLSLKYQFTEHLGLRAGWTTGKLSAHDQNNTPELRSRNLSFQTWLHEANILLEYSLLKWSQRRVSPFIFGGVGLFRFNPFAYDASGNKVFLKPLSTEGQGFPEYPNNKPYRLVQVAIPLGGGIRVKLNPFADLGVEIGFRRLFTDYLDDVSGDYINPDVLERRKGALALKMSFRTDELPNTSATYPGVNYPRGNARYNDWYSFYTTSINFHVTDYLKYKKETRDARCPRF